MSGHAIKDGRAVCLEPETADCRAMWACDCEYLHGLAQLPDGSWVHEAYDYDTDDDVEHQSVGSADALACNICGWLGEDLYGTGPGETWAAGAYNYLDDMPDGAISLEWEGDFYSWDYTEPRVIGALIGRLVVERWADDIGLAA